MKKIIVIILICILAFIFGYFFPHAVENIEPPNPEIIYKDSLVRDTLYKVNDFIEKEIIFLEKESKSFIDSIMSADDSTNLQFFTNYIQNFNNK